MLVAGGLDAAVQPHCTSRPVAAHRSVDVGANKKRAQIEHTVVHAGSVPKLPDRAEPEGWRKPADIPLPRPSRPRGCPRAGRQFLVNSIEEPKRGAEELRACTHTHIAHGPPDGAGGSRCRPNETTAFADEAAGSACASADAEGTGASNTAAASVWGSHSGGAYKLVSSAGASGLGLPGSPIWASRSKGAT